MQDDRINAALVGPAGHRICRQSFELAFSSWVAFGNPVRARFAERSAICGTVLARGRAAPRSRMYRRTITAAHIAVMAQTTTLAIVRLRLGSPSGHRGSQVISTAAPTGITTQFAGSSVTHD